MVCGERNTPLRTAFHTERRLRERPVCAGSAHVLGEVQQRQHKENILLPVLQRTVAEVAVVAPVAQGELQGEGLEVSADVGPGI